MNWWTGVKMSLFGQNGAAEAALFRERSRRYLLLHLPCWATDCLRRAEPALAQSPRPLVIWEKQRGAMRVVALDRQAATAGLMPGQPLADARALLPNLDAREIDRPYLERVFSDFADWHSNATPVVAVVTDVTAYGDLCLDITGVSHLFGGEERMLHSLTGRLEIFGFTRIIRRAPSPWKATRELSSSTFPSRPSVCPRRRSLGSPISA
jgi:hypothetical protein